MATDAVMEMLMKGGVCPVCKEQITTSAFTYSHLDGSGDHPPLVVGFDKYLHIHDVYVTHISNTPTVRRVFVAYWRNRYKRLRWRTAVLLEHIGIHWLTDHIERVVSTQIASRQGS